MMIIANPSRQTISWDQLTEKVSNQLLPKYLAHEYGHPHQCRYIATAAGPHLNHRLGKLGLPKVFDLIGAGPLNLLEYLNVPARNHLHKKTAKNGALYRS